MIRRHRPDGRADTGHEAVESSDRARCDPPAVRRRKKKKEKKKLQKNFRQRNGPQQKKTCFAASSFPHGILESNF